MAADGTRKPRRHSHAHPSTQFSARPDEFVPLFVAHPQWLMVFLENVIRERPVAATPEMWNTLLELYLSDATKSARALDLLKNHEVSYL